MTAKVGRFVVDTDGLWHPVVGGAPLPPDPHNPYKGPIIWGASDPDGGSDQDPASKAWATLRSETIAAGGVFNGYRSYGTQDGLPLTTTEKSRHNAGAMLVKHVRTATGGSSAWANIAAGAYDTVYDQMFADMCDLTYGNGVTAPTNSIFTLDSEMDRLTPAHGSNADFKAAWDHLYTRFRSTGPNASDPNNAKVLFGFCPTEFGMRRTAAHTDVVPAGNAHLDRVSDICPPDAQIDILTPDCYNKYAEWHGAPTQYLVAGKEWHTMASIFDFVRAWTVNSGHCIGKQMLVVEGDCQEWGSTTPTWDLVAGSGKGPWPPGSTLDNTKKAAWFTDGVAYMKANPDAIGWLYWNVTYPPNTSTTAYTGWLSAAAAASH